ncbi:MAG TPA: hypothetical protein VFA12_10105 [Stellaceae bacterium]|nr:hypothetical protein [Stellaceae bacterium]
MTGSFVERAITVTFQLGTGAFGNSGFNTLTLEGLRCEVHATIATLPESPSAVLRVYGMTLSQINQLSVAGLTFQERNNRVAIQAGNVGEKLATIFNGTIYEARPDFSNQPDTSFLVIGVGTLGIQLTPVAPTSFKGGVPVETALTAIAAKAGLTVENHGVTAVLSNPYFPGDAMAQIKACLRAADCLGSIDPVRNVLVIWPKLGSAPSSAGAVPTISPATGMIGYPSFSRNYIQVRTLFDPSIKGSGSVFRVESELTAANGLWRIVNIEYDLSSQTPGGPWEMTIEGYPAQPQP